MHEYLFHDEEKYYTPMVTVHRIAFVLAWCRVVPLSQMGMATEHEEVR